MPKGKDFASRTDGRSAMSRLCSPEQNRKRARAASTAAAFLLVVAIQGCASGPRRATAPGRFIDVQTVFTTAPLGHESLAFLWSSADTEQLPEKIASLLAANGCRVGICRLPVLELLDEVRSRDATLQVTPRLVRLLDYEFLRKSYIPPSPFPDVPKDPRLKEEWRVPPARSPSGLTVLLGGIAARVRLVTGSGTLEFANAQPALDVQTQVKADGVISLSFSPVVVGSDGKPMPLDRGFAPLEFELEVQEGEWIMLGGLMVPGTFGEAAFFRHPAAEDEPASGGPSLLERTIFIKADTAEAKLHVSPA